MDLQTLKYVLPDNTAEVISQMIIALLTWWLGRKQGQLKQLNRSKGQRDNHRKED